MKNRNFVGKTWRKPFLQKMWRKENTNTCLGENLGFFVQNVPRNKTHTKIKHGFCGKYPGQHEYLQSREPTIFRAPPRDSHDLNRAPDQGLGEMMSPQLGPCGKIPTSGVPVHSRGFPRRLRQNITSSAWEQGQYLGPDGDGYAEGLLSQDGIDHMM